LGSLYTPQQWPNLVDIFHSIFSNSASSQAEAGISVTNTTTPQSIDPMSTSLLSGNDGMCHFGGEKSEKSEKSDKNDKNRTRNAKSTSFTTSMDDLDENERHIGNFGRSISRRDDLSGETRQFDHHDGISTTKTPLDQQEQTPTEYYTHILGDEAMISTTKANAIYSEIGTLVYLQLVQQ
jgi:hypothetical protein